MGITILLFTPSAIIFLLRRVTLYMLHTCLRAPMRSRANTSVGGKAGEISFFFFPHHSPKLLSCSTLPIYPTRYISVSRAFF